MREKRCGHKLKQVDKHVFITEWLMRGCGHALNMRKNICSKLHDWCGHALRHADIHVEYKKTAYEALAL